MNLTEEGNMHVYMICSGWSNSYSLFSYFRRGKEVRGGSRPSSYKIGIAVLFFFLLETGKDPCVLR
jgi:hypothetical protein